MSKITSLDELTSLYGEPVERSLWKEIDHLNDHYQQFIKKSPFIILATYGDKGIDCSPRGDPAGFVRIVNEKCLQIPDRRGNNRLDSLKNIINNPNVGIIFLVPNVGEAIRVSGTAEILTDKTLRDSFAIDEKAPTSVISINVEKAYYQCQKAIARSNLWDSSTYINRNELPTAGQLTKCFAEARSIEFNADEYDKNYPEHMKKTIY